jgi:integrase
LLDVWGPLAPKTKAHVKRVLHLLFERAMLQKLHLKPAGECIGIAGLGWHAFRHSYRGLLDESGANAGMQKGLMRHANISTTMNVYGRAAIKAKQEANSKVVQMILPVRARCV